MALVRPPHAHWVRIGNPGGGMEGWVMMEAGAREEGFGFDLTWVITAHVRTFFRSMSSLISFVYWMQ